ncbi:MAG: hypothetical protein WCP93_00410 [Candidatus Berkelbacteria bacterium]
MDEIIYLEPDEEITSVIDKMKNAQNKHLGLVVPRGATLLQSVVNLRLLAKEAEVLGKEIAIVTTDQIGSNLAAQVGLPVYNSVKQERPVMQSVKPDKNQDEVLEIDSHSPASESAERPSARRELNVRHFQEDRPIIKWKSRQKPVIQQEKKSEKNVIKNPIHEIDHRAKAVIWPILVIIAILGLFGAYLLWPAVDVQVFVKSDDLKKSLPVVFTTSAKTSDIDQGVFSGVLVEAEVSDTQKFTATGKKNLGGKATGTIMLYNGLDSLNHKYPAGTKLLAQNKTFLTKTAILLPGATVQNLQVVPGSATVDVEAENAGEDYNIKAGKFVIAGLPANQQAAIYGQSANDLKGGFTKEVQVVSKDDYNNALKSVTDSLTASLDQDLKTKSKGLVLIDKAAVIPDPEVSSSSSIDQEATEFELTVKLKKQVMAYDNSKFVDFLIQTLSKQVTVDKMVAINSTDDINLVIDKQSYDKGELDVTTNVIAKIAPKISQDVIKNGIIGKSESAASDFVSSQPGVEKVTFNFRPAFWKKVSSLSNNVKVKINYTTGVGTE